jgi:hypothetical protein
VFRRAAPSAETQLLLDLARTLMRIDAKLDRVLQLLGDEDGEEEVDA